ncbi:MAG TPA: hypothetical protein VJ647_03830, partial [Chitinophagaceae bacterium]|nr:hypothetical protein [Chitinophagaceae bacterium]
MKSVIDMIIPILWKSLNNEVLTAEEQEMLDNWLETSVHNREVFTEIMDEEKRNNELKFLLNLDKQAAWEKISHAIEQHQPVPEAEVMEMNVAEPRKRWFFRYPAAAAAVLLILSGAGIYFLVNRQSKQEIAVIKPVKTGFPADPDSYIHPATDRATVTIADASGARLEEFDLREVRGNIVYNNGKNSFENIQKDKGSVVKFPEVALHPVDDRSSLTFNTLSTPKGGRYHVTLP